MLLCNAACFADRDADCDIDILDHNNVHISIFKLMQQLNLSKN